MSVHPPSAARRVPQVSTSASVLLIALLLAPAAGKAQDTALSGAACAAPARGPSGGGTTAGIRSQVPLPAGVRQAPPPLASSRPTGRATRRPATPASAGAGSRPPVPPAAPALDGGTLTRAAWAAAVRPSYADSLRADRRRVDSLLAASPAGVVVRGDSAAPLTVLEFLDFQCPYCAMHERDGGRAIEMYVRRGLVRVATFDFPLPFHRQAPHAAMFYHCAVAAGADPMAVRTALYAQQAAWAVEDPADVFAQMVPALGVDAAAVRACYRTGPYVPALVHGISLGRALGVSGTPGFLFAGQRMSGTGPASAIQQRLEMALLGSAPAPVAPPTPWLGAFLDAVTRPPSAPTPRPPAP